MSTASEVNLCTATPHKLEYGRQHSWTAGGPDKVSAVTLKAILEVPNDDRIALSAGYSR